MSKEEALEALDQRTRELRLAEGRHASAVLDAVLAGGSQREVAGWACIAVNTVRRMMTDAGIEFAGQRYEVAPVVFVDSDPAEHGYEFNTPGGNA